MSGRCGGSTYCGDGIRQEEEACDDGERTNTGGCIECEVVFGWQCEGEVGEESACAKKTYAQIGGGGYHFCAQARSKASRRPPTTPAR